MNRPSEHGMNDALTRGIRNLKKTYAPKNEE